MNDRLQALLEGYRDCPVTDHAVRWAPDKWRSELGLGAYRYVLDELADRTRPETASTRSISRKDVFELRDRGPVAVFVAAMVFGFGSVNYGPSRTSKMLATPDAEAKINSASEILLASGSEAAHRFMINPPGRLAWCRTPFISKYLYFAGFESTPGLQPLIFDQVVQTRLASLGHSVRLNYTTDYVEFLRLAATFKAEFGLTREDLVEIALFQGDRAETE
jgi:hypothetical protein